MVIARPMVWAEVLSPNQVSLVVRLCRQLQRLTATASEAFNFIGGNYYIHSNISMSDF